MPLNKVYQQALPSVAQFPKQTQVLVKQLRKIKPTALSDLMNISDNLAQLNHWRFKDFSPEFTAENSRPAFWAFDGDVYDGLRARTLSSSELAWAQQHVRMLSGLYGLLRPLDSMQPYRLEMGTSLPNKFGKNLYAVWKGSIANALNAELKSAEMKTVVNLASDEYFKSVDLKLLKAEVIQPVFQERKSKLAPYKVVSFSAKKARGMMVRFAIDRRLTHASELQAFKEYGYTFDACTSDQYKWLFRRDLF